MPTVALDVFLPYLRMGAEGCPEPVLKDALVEVATDFCTRSLCWNERLAAVSVTDASFPYSIPVSAHATITRLLAAHAPNQIWPTSYAALDAVTDWETQLGTPTHYLFNGAGRLIVYPLPSVAAQMKLRVAYTVARSATVLEDFLYNRWRDELVHGALAKLKADTKKTWGDPANVNYHATRFELGVSTATIETRRNLTTLDSQVQMRPLA